MTTDDVPPICGGTGNRKADSFPRIQLLGPPCNDNLNPGLPLTFGRA